MSTKPKNKSVGRRDFLKSAAVAGAGLIILPSGVWAGAARGTAPAAEAAGRGRPNVILCMTDDQGWNDVSYNERGALARGKVKTPNLDAMAAAGLRFDRFYAAAPVCSPTRGSCLTGRHPYRYGVRSPGQPIKRQEMSIAQALQRAGYATAHFGKWHLNGVSGPGKPIAATDPLHPGHFGFETWFSVSNYFERDWTFSRMGTPVATQGDGSDVIVAEALQWIDQVRAKDPARPLFALVWFGSPHVPCKPLAKDLEAAGGDVRLGEVLGADRAMGTLRAGLRSRGIAENTMLWFNSDNGHPGKNTPLKGGKGGIDEGGVRVPGICEWPARVKPGRTAVPVVTSDFYLTILDATGVPLPANQVQPLDGISVLPLLEGKMAERPQPIGFMAGNAVALSDNRYKLVVSQEKGKGGRESVALYDLVEDLGEQKNLAAEQPAIVTKMRSALDAWKASVDRSANGGDYAGPQH